MTGGGSGRGGGRRGGRGRGRGRGRARGRGRGRGRGRAHGLSHEAVQSLYLSDPTTHLLTGKGIKPGSDVTLLQWDGRSGLIEKVGTGVVFGDENVLLYNNHGADVRTTNHTRQVCLVWKCKFEQRYINLPYEYEMLYNEEQPQPDKLGDMISGFRYAWDANQIVPLQLESGTGNASVAPVFEHPRSPMHTQDGTRKRTFDQVQDTEPERNVRMRTDIAQSNQAQEQEAPVISQPRTEQDIVEQVPSMEWLLQGQVGVAMGSSMQPDTNRPPSAVDNMAKEDLQSLPRTNIATPAPQTKVNTPPIPAAPMPPVSSAVQSKPPALSTKAPHLRSVPLSEYKRNTETGMVLDTPSVEPVVQTDTSPPPAVGVDISRGATSPSQNLGRAFTPTADPEVMEVVPEPRGIIPQISAKSVKKLDLSNYKRITVSVNIDDIEFSDNSVRDIEDEHVDELVQSISINGLLYSSGTIAVTVMDRNVLKDINAHIQLVNGQSRFLGRTKGLDGVHRRLALKRVANMVDPARRETFIWVQAELWFSPNLEPMSQLEIISIGTNLNATSSKVRKSSFRDNVHSTLSCVRIVCTERGIPPRQLDRQQLVSSMKTLNTLPDVSENQYTKYANIAIAFARNNIPTTVFKTHSKVSLVHSSNDTMLRGDRLCTLLCLECVDAYLQTAPPKGQKKGAFEDVADGFYDNVMQLYAQVRLLAEEKDMAAETLLNTEVPLTSTNISKKRKVRDIIRNNMATFLKKGVNKMREKQEARLGTLKRCVGFMQRTEKKTVSPVALPAAVASSAAASASATPVAATPVAATPANATPDAATTASAAATPDAATTASAAATPDAATTASAAATPAAATPASATPASATPAASPTTDAQVIVALSDTDAPQQQPRRSERTTRKKPETFADLEFDAPAQRKSRAKRKTAKSKAKKAVGAAGKSGNNNRQVIEVEVASEDEESRESSQSGAGDDVSNDGELGGDTRQEEIALFDDSLPALLPVGYNDISAWEGAKRPAWVFKSAMQPMVTLQHGSVEIPHVTPWLEFMFIPKGHRAHIMCKPEDLYAVYEQTFFRGALEWCRQNRAALKPYLAGNAPVAGEVAGETASEASTDTYVQLAEQLGWTSAAYFGEQRVKLDELGYCILQNFARSEGKYSAVSRVDKLMEYFLSTFPGEEALKDPRNRDLWNPICNAGGEVDEQDRRHGIGRIMTTLEGASVHLEQEESTVWVAKERALLDVRLANILVALKIGNHMGTETLSIPKSGGRFLYTSKHCRRQNLHTDFEVNRLQSMGQSPGYFCVVTGSTSSPLWVLPRSSTYAKLPSRTCRELSHALHVEKVVIPPFSVFIGRGDMLHADPAHSDYDDPPTDGGLRYHMYFVPRNLSLVDGLHHMPDLNPPYLEDQREAKEVSPSLGAPHHADEAVQPERTPIVPKGMVKQPLIQSEDSEQSRSDSDSLEDEESDSELEEGQLEVSEGEDEN